MSKVYDRSSSSARWRDAWPGRSPARRLPFAALDRVDLTIRPGESLGLIGPNGAGKTTVLKLIAGVTRPTIGEVEVPGSVSAMIELGVGFHPELTGWENLELAAAVHGIEAELTRAATEEIVEFAGIRRAMDDPLKTYSTGMQARLAFSLATHLPADVLVVDEILAVGDAEFQQRCRRRIAEMVDAGTSLVLVSHEMPLVSSSCERAIAMEAGRIVDDGPAGDVVERYLRGGVDHRPQASRPTARVRSATISEVVRAWDPTHIEIEIEVTDELADPMIGIALSLPAVEPGLVIGASRSSIPEVRRPGRYALHGTMTGLGLHNALLRIDVDLVDGADAEDHATLVSHLPDAQAGRTWLALDPQWSSSPVDDRDDAAAPRRSAPDGSGLLTLTGVAKRYPLHRGRVRVRPAVPAIDPWSGGPSRDVLSDIDLQVAAGEVLGVIGPNGSGKSTLLRIIGGITRPDRGRLEARCRIVPMLDLGAGMHPELTGRENIGVSLELLGAPEANVDDIVAMAGIGAAIDASTRQYSSGMRARIGFAIAVHADGDLFLIDELLAVGDEQFRDVALHAIGERVDEGASAIFVSHSLQLVEQFCHRVICLNHGQVVAEGTASEVIDFYGGSHWGSGAHDATSGVHLGAMSTEHRSIEVGGTIVVNGEVTVAAPSPNVRLELAYRSIGADWHEGLALEAHDEEHTFYIRTIDAAADVLARPGRHAFELTVARHALVGRFHLVLSIVDESDEVLSQRWQEVQVGNPPPNAYPRPVFDLAWTIDRLDPTRRHPEAEPG